MSNLFQSHYSEPWRGLPFELREQIYIHLLCPPSGIDLVPYVHRGFLPEQSREHPDKLYVEEQRFSPDDTKTYHYDRQNPTGRSDPTVDKEGYSDYDRGLVPDPYDKVAPSRSQQPLNHLNLFLASKQAHVEASQVFYGRNVWRIDTRCNRILYFLQWLDPSYRMKIRDIRVTSEATLRHKGNLRHKDLTTFLATEMKLHSVTFALPEGYIKHSFFYNMGELRYLPEIFTNLTKSVWEGKIGSLRIHYDHANAEPEREKLHRLAPVASIYGMYENEYKEHFVYLLGMQFRDWMGEYAIPRERNPLLEEKPSVLDDIIEKHRLLYPFRFTSQTPQKELGEIGPVIEMRVDLAAAKAEITRLENIIARGEDRKIEEEETKALGQAPPSLHARLGYAKDAMRRFEMPRTKEAWKGLIADGRVERMAVKRTRSSYV